MALIDKDVARFLGGGAVGAGAVLVFPYIKPIAGAIARPLVKAAIRSGVLAFERGREGLAHATESLEDILAEVRSELESELEERSVETTGSAVVDEAAAKSTNGSGAGSA